MSFLNKIIEDMNNLQVKDNENEPKEITNNITNVQQLPSLSAQACPITIVRGNSALTKRISYSETLKDRFSFQFPRHDLLLDRSVQENSFENICQQSVICDQEQLKYITNDGMVGSPQMFRIKSLQNPTSSSCTVEALKRNHSFKECQQIFAKIQHRFSNKSLRKSSTTIRSTASEPNHRELCHRRNKRKQKLNAVLFKNDNLRSNNQLNPYCKQCKNNEQYCHHHIKTKKKNREQEHQNERHTSTQDIYGQSLRYGNVKQIHHIKKSRKKSKEMETFSINIPSYELRNVYYSEKQSLTVEDVPGVPPCTPNETIVNGIASLSDIKSQRNIQQKLRDIRDRQKKKEKELLEAAKAKETQQKIMKRKELMEMQRQQIYAINKVLLDIENEEFLKSKTQTKGVPV